MKADAEKLILIIEKARTQIESSLLTPDADLREVGADSLDMMNIFLEVQEQFDIEIPDQEIGNLTTVIKICDFVNAQVA